MLALVDCLQRLAADHMLLASPAKWEGNQVHLSDSAVQGLLLGAWGGGWHSESLSSLLPSGLYGNAVTLQSTLLSACAFCKYAGPGPAMYASKKFAAALAAAPSRVRGSAKFCLLGVEGGLGDQGKRPNGDL
jgi:hypothetical protein